MRLAVKAYDDQREVRFFIVEFDAKEALTIMEAVKAGLPGIGKITGVTLEAKEAMLVGWHEALEEIVERAELAYAVTTLGTAEAEIYAPTCLLCVTSESVYWLAWPHDRFTPVDSFTLEQEDVEALLTQK
jgi:hypothetical protein